MARTWIPREYRTFRAKPCWEACRIRPDSSLTSLYRSTRGNEGLARDLPGRASVLGDTGLEQSALTPPKTQISQTRGGESGAPAARIPTSDPDLDEIVRRWPGLHPAVKEHVLSLVRGSDPDAY